MDTGRFGPPRALPAERYHCVITSLAWGLYEFGVMITAMGISSYILDSYPEVSS